MKWRGSFPVLFPLLLLSLFDISSSITTKSNCQCSLFKQNTPLPENLVFSLGINRYINCSDIDVATKLCKRWCEGEMVAMRALVSKDPSLLQNHQPNSHLQCSSEPQDTEAFVSVCFLENLLPASNFNGPSVCCNSVTRKLSWCPSVPFEEEWTFQHLGNEIQSRRLNLHKDPNDISINEIEDTGKPEKTATELIGASSKPESSVSWIKTALKFFGYTSFGDLIKNVDIFALPGKIKKAVKTYKDELSMGRCYMEFTTFKIFTKEENPFEDLLRRKRETSEMESHPESESFREVNVQGKEARKRAVQNFVKNIANLMGKSETTRSYAGLINTFLPIIAQMYTGESSSVAPTLLNMVGPVLKQLQFSRPSSKPSEKIGSHNSVPSYSKPSSPSQDSSPLTSMAIGLAGNLIRNFLSSPPEPVNKVSEIPSSSLHPERPAAPLPTLGDLGSQGIGTLVKLLFQGIGKNPRPVARPRPTQKPIPQKPPQKESVKENKSFIDMLLEVIRPIFISIMGETPGESGIKDIRRVSTLSTLGRVDDTLREEVDSPFFCFKKYAVNKAWSVTEYGVRTVVDTFTPEEQERMMRMLKS